MDTVSQTAAEPQAEPQAERVYHAEVVGMHVESVLNPAGGYRHEIAAKDATLYVTLPEALPLWAPYDIVLRPVPSE